MSVLRDLGKSDAGAAIVESLVATTLLGVALVFLLGSYSTIAISSRTAEQVARGHATARAQAARISAAPYQASGDYSAYYETLPTGLTRSVAVTWWNGTNAWVGTQNANGLEKIVVAITYDSKPVASIELVKGNR
jgi:type II secretory pathway pseudopilin PulG